jgi:hypothetical protein
VGSSGKLWEDLEKEDLIEHVLALEPTDRRLGADDKTIDAICLASPKLSIPRRRSPTATTSV